MELKFDDKGYLMPYGRISISLEEFEQFFIRPFQESSRREIFQSYLKFIDDFKKEITVDFKQWIDGSFVTQKITQEI